MNDIFVKKVGDMQNKEPAPLCSRILSNLLSQSLIIAHAWYDLATEWE